MVCSLKTVHDSFHHRMHTPFHIRAPGRINLIGEHVDYQGGWVMPMAIEPSIEAVITPLDQAEVQLTSDQRPGELFTCAIDKLTPQEGSSSWANYVLGVVAVYAEEGQVSPGFRMALSATLPSGAGLSSSAALETVTALAVEHLTGVSLDPLERALRCQRAEHIWAGVPCGIMDQLAVGACQAGHALMIDCRDQTMSPVRLPEGLSVVVADTRVQHALADGEYKKRRSDCEAAAAHFAAHTLREVSLDQVNAARDELGDRLFRRARHVVTEIARVPLFVDALQHGDFDTAGRLMRASHDSLRDDFEVSCPELDTLVDAAYALGPEFGVVGSRMTGGGFGGSAISLVKHEAVPAFTEQLQQAFSNTYGRRAEIFTTRAAAAASTALS